MEIMKPDIPNVIRCIKADGSGMTTIEGSNIESYFLDEDENIISRDFEYGNFRMVNRTDCGWAGVILKDILRYGQLSESERKEMGDILYLTNYDLDRICFSKDGESVKPVDHYCIRTWEMSEEGRIDWTFFKMIYEKDGSGHGEEVCDGASYYQL